MNIFYTSNCPIESAKYLDDVRVNKMIIETAQLLSSGLIRAGLVTNEEASKLYKTRPQGKQLAEWSVLNINTYTWMLEHLKALNSEYMARHDKTVNHLTYEKLYDLLSSFKSRLASGDFVTPPNWTENKSKGINYKHIKCVSTAYMMYLSDRWETDKKTPKFYGVER